MVDEHSKDKETEATDNAEASGDASESSATSNSRSKWLDALITTLDDEDDEVLLESPGDEGEGDDGAVDEVDNTGADAGPTPAREDVAMARDDAARGDDITLEQDDIALARDEPTPGSEEGEASEDGEELDQVDGIESLDDEVSEISDLELEEVQLGSSEYEAIVDESVPGAQPPPSPPAALRPPPPPIPKVPPVAPVVPRALPLVPADEDLQQITFLDHSPEQAAREELAQKEAEESSDLLLEIGADDAVETGSISIDEDPDGPATEDGSRKDEAYDKARAALDAHRDQELIEAIEGEAKSPPDDLDLFVDLEEPDEDPTAVVDKEQSGEPSEDVTAVMAEAADEAVSMTDTPAEDPEASVRGVGKDPGEDAEKATGEGAGDQGEDHGDDSEAGVRDPLEGDEIPIEEDEEGPGPEEGELAPEDGEHAPEDGEHAPEDGEHAPEDEEQAEQVEHAVAVAQGTETEEEEEAEQQPGEVLDEAIQRAQQRSIARLEKTLARELAAEDDPVRQARLQYELGHLSHARKDEEQAAKAYAQALSLDPRLRPNVWAIGSIFRARALWPNLLKLFDAQIRFEESEVKRADLLLEKGWIQQEKIKDLSGARESYWEAFRANEEWLAPLLALEKLALAQGDNDELAQVYRRMIETAAEPDRKITVLIELARLQEHLDDGTPQAALQLLDQALDLERHQLQIMEMMEQIAAAAGLHEERCEILHRQAELLLHPEAPNRPEAVARMRLAAQVAAGTLDNVPLSQQLLQAAVAELPEEKILHRDLLAMAESSGDWTQVATLLEERLESTDDDVEKAAIYFKISLAGIQEKSPRAAEAMENALRHVPGYLPVLAAQERKLLGDWDWRALVDLYLAEADAVESRSAGLPLATAADTEWVATSCWRAGALLHRRLDEPERAIEACLRALDASPEFRPALDQLEQLYRETGQRELLIEALERQLSLAGEGQACILLEDLLALCSSDLDSADRQLVFLKKLGALQPDDLSILRRQATLLERLDRYAELEKNLLDLEERDPDEALQISWKLARASLLERKLDRPEDAARVYEEILARAPGHAYALAALSALLRKTGRNDDLAAVLQQAADLTLDEVKKVQLLNAVASLHITHRDDPERAADAYAELCSMRPDDPVFLDLLTRSAGDCNDSEVLSRALESQADSAEDPAVSVAPLIRLAELIQDRQSDPALAEEMLVKAIAAAPSRRTVVDAVEDVLRRQISRGDHEAARGHLEALEREGPEEVRRVYLEERAWLSAPPLGDPDDAGELYARLLEQDPTSLSALLGQQRLSASRRDSHEMVPALTSLAGATSDPSLAVLLNLRAGLMADAQGDSDGTAADSYRRVLQQDPGQLEAALALLAKQGLPAEERAQLMQQVAGHAPDRIREEMRLPLAHALEGAGRFKDALGEIRVVLERDPEQLSAWIILQRLCQASGQREQEAQVWTRMAEILSDRTAQAEAYARASELLQECGQIEAAAILLRHVLVRTPSDSHSFERLRGLYQDEQNVKGLEELLGHQIQHTEKRGMLIGLHFERAELRLQRLGDREGAARDLMKILQLDGNHLEALRQIAHLHDEDGHPRRALALHRRYLEVADSSALRRPAVIRVAQILADHSRAADAIDTCRRFLLEAPEDDRVMELVVDLYIKVRDYPHAIETLEKLGTLRADPAWKATNNRRIGIIFWKEMRDLHEARTTLLRSRDMDPTNIEVVDDLRQLNDEMDLQEDTSRLLERAKDDLREALSSAPLDLELFKKLMKLAEWAADRQVLLASMGVLCYFNAVDEGDQDMYQRGAKRLSFNPKKLPAVPAWRGTLMARGARSAYSEIWGIIADLVPRLYEIDLPSDPAAMGLSRSDRVDKKSGGALYASVERMARALGLGTYTLYVSQRDPQIVTGICQDRPCLVIGATVAEDLSAANRFRIGRTIAMIRDRAFAVEALGRDVLERLFSAAVLMVQPGAAISLPRAEVEGESKRLMKAMSRKARKALPLAVERFMQEVPNLDAWVEGVLETANRAGLLTCGDICTALDCSVDDIPSPAVRARKSQHEIMKIIENTDRAKKLLTYAVNRDYLALRRELQV